MSKAVEKLKSTFDLDKYKQKKNLVTVASYKEDDYLDFPKSIQESLGVQGFPLGGVSMLMGHSDTGKTTMLLRAAVEAQKRGILPVFIITELKWNWDHAKELGLQFEEKEIVDEETGEIVKTNSGFFIYVDSATSVEFEHKGKKITTPLDSIEKISSFILTQIQEQADGDLACDLLFLWDSVGSVPSEQTNNSNSSNNEWDAGAMERSVVKGGVVRAINASRKADYKFTNTLIAVNKIWLAKPSNPMGQPKMRPKGGVALLYASTCAIQLGNVANAGTSKVNFVSKGKTVEIGKIVNVQLEKWHTNHDETGAGISKGKVIMVRGGEGFIENTDKGIKGHKESLKAKS